MGDSGEYRLCHGKLLPEQLQLEQTNFQKFLTEIAIPFESIVLPDHVFIGFINYFVYFLFVLLFCFFLCFVCLNCRFINNYVHQPVNLSNYITEAVKQELMLAGCVVGVPRPFYSFYCHILPTSYSGYGPHWG